MVLIYPSFSSEDYDFLNGFIGMFQNPNNVLNGVPLLERENLEGHPKKIIKNALRPLIRQADLMILLLGKNTHSRKWVKYEIDVALKIKIPIFAVRLPIENPGGLPPILKGKVDIVEYNVRKIQSAIDRHI